MDPHKPSSVKMEVNLQSVDAMFATLIADGRHLKEMFTERMDTLEKTLGEIKEQVSKTNGRVTTLENFRNNVAAKVSGFVIAISAVGAVLAWALEHALRYFAGS